MLPLTKCASNFQLDNSKFLLPISHSLVTVSQLGGGNPVKFLARAHCTVCASACLGLFCLCAIILYYYIVLLYHTTYIIYCLIISYCLPYTLFKKSTSKANLYYNKEFETLPARSISC